MFTRDRLPAVMQLIGAAVLWGFGFTCTVWALRVLNAAEISFLRFLVVMVAGLPLFLSRKFRRQFKAYLQMAFIPAIFMILNLVLQTWGMQYTTAAKSGFITTLYVVFVPVMDVLVRRVKLPLPLWECVLVALAGTALIVNLGVHDLNFGDELTFLCAICAAMQIYFMGWVSPRVSEPFIFNFAQIFWSMILLSPTLFSSDLRVKMSGALHWPWQAQVGLLCLAFGSTLVAFYFQIRAQARLSPSVSGLLCLLESPFALIFSVVILSESLSVREAIGAGLVFAAAIAATLIESKRGALDAIKVSA